MSLKAYEDACVRAELFGQPIPDKKEFLESHKHLDVVEFEEVEIGTAENTAMLDEDMKGASRGLDELNSILNTTHTKINKLKGVCGSLTNFFRGKLTAKDNLSYSSEPSYIGQTNFDKDSVKTGDIGSIKKSPGHNFEKNEMTPRAGNSKQYGGGDINSGLNDLEAMQNLEDTSLVSKAAAQDIGKQVTSQMSKLDQMIMQTDRAQASLSHQNKQRRSFKS